MTGSESKPSSLSVEEARKGGLSTASTARTGLQLGTVPYSDMATLQKVSNAYKEGTVGRVLAKVGMAGAAGFMLGPFAHTGPVLTSAFVTGANAVAVVGFYDVLREALTALTVTDTPLLSLLAGGLTGYVWSGIVHQTRPQAVGGAMVLGSAAALSHAVFPEFDARKFALSVLLDTGSIKDTPEGTLQAEVDSAPVLTPYSHSETRAYFLGVLSQLSPIKEISDEEYEDIKSTKPFVISSRRREIESGEKG